MNILNTFFPSDIVDIIMYYDNINKMKEVIQELEMKWRHNGFIMDISRNIRFVGEKDITIWNENKISTITKVCFTEVSNKIRLDINLMDYYDYGQFRLISRMVRDARDDWEFEVDSWISNYNYRLKDFHLEVRVIAGME